jgi:hypothetical protein
MSVDDPGEDVSEIAERVDVVDLKTRGADAGSQLIFQTDHFVRSVNARGSTIEYAEPVTDMA